jgi:hypothetical protein
VDILSHDYHLHQDLGAISRDNQLWDFLQKGGIEPKPKLLPPPSSGQKWWCSDGKDGLFDPDSSDCKDKLFGPDSTQSS